MWQLEQITSGGEGNWSTYYSFKSTGSISGVYALSTGSISGVYALNTRSIHGFNTLDSRVFQVFREFVLRVLCLLCSQYSQFPACVYTQYSGEHGRTPVLLHSQRSEHKMYSLLPSVLGVCWEHLWSAASTRSTKPWKTWKYGGVSSAVPNPEMLRTREYPQYGTSKYCEYSQVFAVRTLEILRVLASTTAVIFCCEHASFYSDLLRASAVESELAGLSRLSIPHPFWSRGAVWGTKYLKSN